MGNPTRSPDGPEDLLFVPREFEDAHLDRARREVAAAHRRSPEGRRVPRSRWADRSQVARARLAVGALHSAAALLVVVFGALTRTWLAAAVVLACVAASQLLVGWVVVTLTEIWSGENVDHPGRASGRASRR